MAFELLLIVRVVKDSVITPHTNIAITILVFIRGRVKDYSFGLTISPPPPLSCVVGVTSSSVHEVIVMVLSARRIRM